MLIQSCEDNTLVVELRSSNKLPCNFCKKKFSERLMFCSFFICGNCYFLVTHEGRTPEQQLVHDVTRLKTDIVFLKDRVDKLEKRKR